MKKKQLPRPSPPSRASTRIQVLEIGDAGALRDSWHATKLRQKGRYLYLHWRNGKHVRSLYIGKQARASPTRAGSRSPRPPARSSLEELTT